MISRVLRALAVLTVMLWIAALLSPARQITFGYGPHPHFSPFDGWSLTKFGWLGPVAGIFAWYANPLLLVIVVRLARGHSPGRRLSLIAIALAATVFLPGFVFDFELDGRFHPTFIVGPAVWLWVGAFVVAALGNLLHTATNSA